MGTGIVIKDYVHNTIALFSPTVLLECQQKAQTSSS